MFVCVVLLSQPSSRDLLYAKRLCVVSLSQPSSRDLLYVKCLCVSRYLSPVVGILFVVEDVNGITGGEAVSDASSFVTCDENSCDALDEVPLPDLNDLKTALMQTRQHGPQQSQIKLE